MSGSDFADFIRSEISDTRKEVESLKERLLVRSAQNGIIREMRATISTGTKHLIMKSGDSGELVNMYEKLLSGSEGNVTLALQKLLIAHVEGAATILDKQASALRNESIELNGTLGYLSKKLEKMEKRLADLESRREKNELREDVDADGRPRKLSEVEGAGGLQSAPPPSSEASTTDELLSPSTPSSEAPAE